IHKNVDNVLHDVIPKIASNATNDIIKDNLPKVIVEAIMKERDTFQNTVPALISKEFADHALKLIEELFQSYMHNNVEEPISKVDEVILEDETPELIEEFQNVDMHVPTIYDHERIKATLRDMMSNQFRNAKEYAYHLEQSNNYMENQIDSWHKIFYKMNHRRARANPEEYFSDYRIAEVVRVTTEQ
ncbi:hypothetical protein Tco_1579848, partial [Tanacetum coccineum]